MEDAELEDQRPLSKAEGAIDMRPTSSASPQPPETSPARPSSPSPDAAVYTAATPKILPIGPPRKLLEVEGQPVDASGGADEDSQQPGTK